MIPHPVIYELNTFVWLQQLSAKYHRRITLSSVPPAEWDGLRDLGCDAVWLMGVWQRSPEARRIALSLTGIVSECRRILPGCADDDIPGSPYAIKAYQVDERFGSLGSARASLAERGLKLILDFVPNHVAPDHAWVVKHPEYFMRGTQDDLARSPGFYFLSGSSVLAFGRDPYFPAWTDTVQVNAFSSALRQAAAETLLQIADQCDGVRCDMAMLLLNDVFAKTWGASAGEPPDSEYWTDLINAVRARHPHFLFIAEAYWNREWDLQQLGFDYCYDKRLYDRLLHEDASSVHAHLTAGLNYQQHLIRFLENHDEERVAAALPLFRHKASAVAIATLPGATLYYDGQFCGKGAKLPVQLGRAPDEPCDPAFVDFYSQLRTAAREITRDDAEWSLLRAAGWADNDSAKNLLAWCWSGAAGRFLIVINFSEGPAQGRISLPWTDLPQKLWRLVNLLGGELFSRDGMELQTKGLYVALEPWRYYLLRFE